MAKKFMILFSLILLVISLTSCVETGNEIVFEFDSEKPTVYVSVFPMYDFVKKISSGKVNIIELMPQGQEPHDWEMSPKDMVGVESANLFVYSGAGLEPWIDNLMGSVNNKDLVFLEASKGINLTNGDTEYTDPHVWLNPKNAKIQMKNIADALSLIDPGNEKFYQKNYESVAKRIDSLHERYIDAVSELKCKTIVVPHEAFGYLCSEYGLTQIGVASSMEGSEPSAARIKEIIDYVKENNITSIFYDVAYNPDLINKIAEETNVTLGILNSFEVLVSDLDYFAVMDYNLVALQDAFKK